MGRARAQDVAVRPRATRGSCWATCPLPPSSASKPCSTRPSPRGMEAWRDPRPGGGPAGARVAPWPPRDPPGSRPLLAPRLRNPGGGRRLVVALRGTPHRPARHLPRGSAPTVTPFFIGASPLLDARDRDVTVAAFERLRSAADDLIEAIGETAGRCLRASGPRTSAWGPASGTCPPRRARREGFSESQLAAARAARPLPRTPRRAAAPALLRPADEDMTFAHWGAASVRGERAWALVTESFALELATTTGKSHVHALLRDPAATSAARPGDPPPRDTRQRAGPLAGSPDLRAPRRRGDRRRGVERRPRPRDRARALRQHRDLHRRGGPRRSRRSRGRRRAQPQGRRRRSRRASSWSVCWSAG